MARTKKIEETATTTTEVAVEETATAKKKTTAKKAAAADKERKAYFMEVRVTFTAPLLGTNPQNPKIYSDWIAANADPQSKAEEIEHLGQEEVEQKGMTVFMRRRDDPSIPQLKDYTWLGFIKERSRGLAPVAGTVASGMKAYIQEVNRRVKITPRFMDLHLPEGEAIDIIQRPLRASGPSGERTALAISEVVPEGTTCEFMVRTETKEGMKLVIESLNEGAIHGTGQWRNAGNGTFTWEKLKMWSEVIVDDDTKNILGELANL